MATILEFPTSPARERVHKRLAEGFSLYEEHLVQVQETWAQTLTGALSLMLLMCGVPFFMWVLS